MSIVQQRDEIIYELNVRAFCDSNGDGIGDFQGLMGKIDYLQKLGITTLLLQPLFPSPLRDSGFDVTNFKGIHPAYGTLRDFQELLDLAHHRGLRVMIDLIISHTSDQHPWFRQAQASKRRSRRRDFFVWSDSIEGYNDIPAVHKDSELSNWAWDPVANSYYWHRFHCHEPDLNYEHPEVRRSMLDIAEHWLEMGVDGLSLIGIPHSFEQDGIKRDSQSQTHAFLRELRQCIDARSANRILLARSDQWPDSTANCFGNGDECHFGGNEFFLPKLLIAQYREDRLPVMEILDKTPQPPENCRWVVWNRHNHAACKRLNNEERDYISDGFGVDPRMTGHDRRLAPLLGNHRTRIELVNALLLSLPGIPVFHYGDEIGMGDNMYLGARNGICTPMQWSPDRNAGFSNANPQSLYLPVITDPEYDYKSVNVEVEENNPHSLLRWMRTLISLRRKAKPLGYGTLEFLPSQNRQTISFVRQCEDDSVLVIANLSRFAQPIEIDLSKFNGLSPIEMFGNKRFPSIGNAPYFFTLAPHGFYWFKLERTEAYQFRSSESLVPARTAGM
jgi:maltose alpha-D-glucosyltransferase / alpha-amylase